MPVHCPLSVPIDMKRSATERAWGKLVQPRLRLGHSLRARMHYSTLHSDMANMFSQMIHEFMSWWVHCTIALRQIDGTCKALFKAEQVMTSKAQTFGLMLVHVVNCGNMHNTYTIQAGSPHKGLWFEIVFDAAQDVGTQIHMSSVFFFLMEFCNGRVYWTNSQPVCLHLLSTAQTCRDFFCSTSALETDLSTRCLACPEELIPTQDARFSLAATSKVNLLVECLQDSCAMR